jgi:tripartite-type tricarboxylate transporter receptor subunit TctC
MAHQQKMPFGLMLLCIMVGAMSNGTAAQDYPAKPVRYMVPSSPGSAVDTIGRIVASGLSEVLGQQVVVENRAGAGGNIGAAMIAKAPPDGYSLLQINNNHTTNVNLYRNLSYDLMRDFMPVTKLAVSPYAIVVHPSMPVKSIADLIKLAKARPGVITYSSAGIGSGTFMATELFKSQARLNMLHVPYVGGGPALTAVISGEALLYGAPVATALPQIQAGRLRALGVTTDRRIALLPGVPTVAETLPGYEFSAWAAIVVPLKTQGNIIAAVRNAAVKVLNKPELVKRMSDLGYIVALDTPAELANFLKVDIEKMAALIRENNLTAN